MEKPDFKGFTDKAKSGTGEAIKRIKTGTNDSVAAVKQKVERIQKAVQDKKAEHATKDKNEKKPPIKKAEDRVKLDDELRIAVDQYNDAYTTMNDNGANLYNERCRAVDLILHIENLVNSIANRPKEFDTEVAEIQMHRATFVDACEFAKAELEAAKKSALGAGAGAAAGAAIVSVAPTVAMWVATTFGTASTGTAISALSGAAAQSAALAWLGGGTLAMGGGGMAAGQAFLAMTGPIGWSVAGVTLLSSIVLFGLNKFKLDKQKKEEIEAVKNNTNIARKTAAQLQEMLDENKLLKDRLNELYRDCMIAFRRSFTELTYEQQMQLGALVNNTKALAASLGKSLQ